VCVLSGCYVVPLQPDVATITPVVVAPAAAVALASAPTNALAARLYPANELAAQRGMLTGTVFALPAGRGRFALDVDGERLIGEATRVQGDERRGIASAYGARGTYLTCDYRMTSASRGTGSCTLSDGARYTVHLGS
jgi:hypothetical protein